MEEKKTLLFIFNPFSGKAQIKNQLMDIVDTMVKAGYEVTIYPTQAPEDAIHKVEVDAEKICGDSRKLFFKACGKHFICA